MRIVFYVGYQSEAFAASTLEKRGLGGSEQAVIYLSNALVRDFGHEVWVAGQVLNEDAVVEGSKHQNAVVRYRETERLKSELGQQSINCVIGVSYIHYLIELKELNFKKSYFWVHNTGFFPWFRGEPLPNGGRDLLADPRLAKVICLSKWHQNQFSSDFPEVANKISVIGNGVAIERIAEAHYHKRFDIESAHAALQRINDDDKIPGRYFYSSHAERGLARVLQLWPEILAKDPNATLMIATPSYGVNYFEQHFGAEVEKIQSAIYLGNLQGAELYQQMRQAQYWLYPSRYEETFCITALEMLANKVKPITYQYAALKETLNGFNLSEEDQSFDSEAAVTWAYRNNWKLVAEKWLHHLYEDEAIDFAYIVADHPRRYSEQARQSLGLPQGFKVWCSNQFVTDSVHKQQKNALKARRGASMVLLQHLQAWTDTVADDREITLITTPGARACQPINWEEIRQMFMHGVDIVNLAATHKNWDKSQFFNPWHYWQRDRQLSPRGYLISKRAAVYLLAQFQRDPVVLKKNLIDAFAQRPAGSNAEPLAALTIVSPYMQFISAAAPIA